MVNLKVTLVSIVFKIIRIKKSPLYPFFFEVTYVVCPSDFHSFT